MDGDPNDDLPDSGYEDEEDDEEDKWSPSLSRKRAGLTKNDLRLEGKVKRWKQWKFVMADGPKNSTSYRLCKANDMEEFDDPAAKNLMESRLGEEKERNGKTFKYGKSHAKTIQGVAWVVDESLMKSHPEDFPTPLDLLKPKKLLPLLTTTVNGEKITMKMKVVDCVVKIKWLIGEAYISTWESRQTVRRIGDLKEATRAFSKPLNTKKSSLTTGFRASERAEIEVEHLSEDSTAGKRLVPKRAWGRKSSSSSLWEIANFRRCRKENGRRITLNHMTSRNPKR